MVSYTDLTPTKNLREMNTKYRAIKFIAHTATTTILSLFTAQAQAVSWDDLSSKRVESDYSIMWQQVAPGGSGMSRMLRYHPTLANVVTLIPDMWNGYQSENNGESWYNIIDFDGDGSFNRPRELTYSLTDPNFGVAICLSELWTTSDMGRTWRLVHNAPWYDSQEDGSDKTSWISKVAAITIDPNDKNIWYVAGGSNVRGEDSISSMTGSNAENPRSVRSDNKEGLIWKTCDAGKSWSVINRGIDPKCQVSRFIINRNNSQQIFAASNYGLYRSDNGGGSWQSITKNKVDSDIIIDMDAYYNAETGRYTLYIIDQIQYFPAGETTTCRGGIFRSDDLGETWQKINGNIALDYNRLSGSASNSYYKYIASWFNIPFEEAKRRYPKLPTDAIQYLGYLAADPSCDGRLYVGFGDPERAMSIVPGRLWVTHNGGDTWINTARLYGDVWEADRDYWEERGNPWHENMVVGHFSPHLQWGKSYAQRAIRSISVSINGDVMIHSDHTTSLSRDHGKSWHQVDEEYTPSGAIIGRGNSDMPAHIIAQDRQNVRTILGSGEHYGWIPTYDDPKGRIALKFIDSSQESINSIAFDPYDGDVVYTTSCRQAGKQYIFRSDDGGHNWVKHGVATPATNKWGDDFYTKALTIDPINSQYFYLGITKIADPERSSEGGFFRSEDGGLTFKQSNRGLPEITRISDIAFDPQDPSRKSLFAAAQWNSFNHPKTTGGGLYHSSDRGKNWTKVKLPQEIRGVEAIQFDQSNRLYITTGYRGGGAGVWYSDDYGKKWSQIFNYEGAEFIDISPFDRDLIAVSVGFLSKNPGVYLSRDRGLSWSKCNREIAIPNHINDIKFDTFNAGKMWVATHGSGFYRGEIKGGDSIQVVKIEQSSIEFNDRKSTKLNASILNPKYQREKITWHSENSAVAAIDKSGNVTPKGRGTTKIWATTQSGRFTDYTIVKVLID